MVLNVNSSIFDIYWDLLSKMSPYSYNYISILIYIYEI